MPRIEGLPTILLSHVARQAIAAGQANLKDAQTEATTGRYHDVGLALGAQTRLAIVFRNDLAALTTTRDQLRQVSLLADVTQSALGALSNLAGDFRSSLLGSRNSQNPQELAEAAAHSALGRFQSIMSTTQDGQYLFGGLRSDVLPLIPYDQGPEQAVTAAFETEFGFPLGDAAAKNISEAEIQSFISGPLTALFTTAGWTSTWSNAADESGVFRISASEEVSVTTNANQPFVQALAMAFAMVDVLGRARLSHQVFQAVADSALQTVSQAQLLTGDEQARIGIGQARLHNATEAFDARRIQLTAGLTALESVDAYEAATRINFLMTQLETSYALTGRLSRMSLLSYI